MAAGLLLLHVPARAMICSAAAGMKDAGNGQCVRIGSRGPVRPTDDFSFDDLPRALTPEEKAFVARVAAQGANADPKDKEKALSLLNIAVTYDSRSTKGLGPEDKAARVKSLQQSIASLDAIDPPIPTVDKYGVAHPATPRAIFTSDMGIVSMKTGGGMISLPSDNVSMNSLPMQGLPSNSSKVTPLETGPGKPPSLETGPGETAPSLGSDIKPGTVVTQDPGGQWRPDPSVPANGPEAGSAAAAPPERPADDMKRAQASAAHAAGMAGALKGSLREDDGMPAGAARAALTAAPARAAEPRGDKVLNLAEPRTPQEILLAAASHPGAFAAVGLKPGGATGAVRKDGSPATDADLNDLRAAIRLEPSALERNPAYLDPARGGVSPQDFASLKTAYRTDAGLRKTEFKDVELVPPEEGRDFKQSASCQLVSGECNPHAEKSYVKGDDVPPQELNGIMASIRRHLGAAAGRSRDDATRARLAGLAARINGFLHGGGGAESAVPIAGAESGAAGDASGAVVGGKAGAAARERALGGARAPVAASGAAGAAGRAAMSVFGGLGLLLLAGAAAVLLRKRA